MTSISMPSTMPIIIITVRFCWLANSVRSSKRTACSVASATEYVSDRPNTEYTISNSFSNKSSARSIRWNGKFAVDWFVLTDCLRPENVRIDCNTRACPEKRIRPTPNETNVSRQPFSPNTDQRKIYCQSCSALKFVRFHRIHYVFSPPSPAARSCSFGSQQTQSYIKWDQHFTLLQCECAPGHVTTEMYARCSKDRNLGEERQTWREIMGRLEKKPNAKQRIEQQRSYGDGGDDANDSYLFSFGTAFGKMKLLRWLFFGAASTRSRCNKFSRCSPLAFAHIKMAQSKSFNSRSILFNYCSLLFIGFPFELGHCQCKWPTAAMMLAECVWTKFEQMSPMSHWQWP